MSLMRESLEHISIVLPDGEPLTASDILKFATVLEELGATGPFPLDDCDRPNHRLCYTVPGRG